MNPDLFKRELEKYPVVRRSDHCKNRSSSQRAITHKEVPKLPNDGASKIVVTNTEADFRTMVEKASKKILDRQDQVKFMVELSKVMRRMPRWVNLEILEEFAKEDAAI